MEKGIPSKLPVWPSAPKSNIPVLSDQVATGDGLFGQIAHPELGVVAPPESGHEVCGAEPGPSEEALLILHDEIRDV